MNVEEYVNAALEQLFFQARVRFGDAVESCWFCQSSTCPGCGREIDTMTLDGQQIVPPNVFVYRERRGLIGYFLCGR